MGACGGGAGAPGEQDVLGTVALREEYEQGAVRHAPLPAIRALDCFPGSNTFIAGTSKCDLWEVDKSARIVLNGHIAQAYTVAFNSARPDLYAVGLNSPRVLLFDKRRRKMVRWTSINAGPAPTGTKVRSLAFSPDGAHLAVGMQDGRVVVLDSSTLQQLVMPRSFQEVVAVADLVRSVDTLRYSPDGRLLAAGSHDTNINIFSCEQGYHQIGRPPHSDPASGVPPLHTWHHRVARRIEPPLGRAAPSARRRGRIRSTAPPPQVTDRCLPYGLCAGADGIGVAAS
ncbi:hypothetical protein CYMTET_29037 [Cymbomonas tetramitiformis]|uniref:Anaphase-promoting complex subunit 4-like WD40 domain-containing protein n=1 Tax=Cymbomonas tetramitiformis TaxID=36881 RepID=A0AAE0FLW6_9CHLO|nr:hypothetical protein CYMTET_29037 [Cymbomonas tetramitiformis]